MTQKFPSFLTAEELDAICEERYADDTLVQVMLENNTGGDGRGFVRAYVRQMEYERQAWERMPEADQEHVRAFVSGETTLELTERAGPFGMFRRRRRIRAARRG